MENKQKNFWVSLSSKQKAVLIAEFLAGRGHGFQAREWRLFLAPHMNVAELDGDDDPYENQEELFPSWDEMNENIPEPLAVQYPHESYY